MVLVLNGLLTIVNFATGAPWWGVWPLLVTGFVLGVHYLFYKMRTTDEDWVQQRVDDLHDRSYDRGHIEDIQSREDEGRRP
ncbi:MAG: 2TM domain-containing protein [Hyphomicrobiaceae bacterium]